MKVVFILFDSLNRHALSCYNQNTHPTPAFDRLAERGVVFDNHYVGSLPCMPARRDLLTGRLNFLHRSWGPIEPFDICFPKLLQEHGHYSHLISDHYHYWEEGGCGYHNQYSSAEFVRGQERDLWKAMVKPPLERFREQYHPMLSGVARRSPNMVNREYVRSAEDYPIVQCVDRACEFLDTNRDADNWLLQVELFDPHEPFSAPSNFRDGLTTDYEGPILDWPIYDKLDLSESEAAELRANYQAVVAMCDHNLQRLLDQFDQKNLWEDTAIVLTSDHGFLLGEKDWWGKNRMPVLDPIARIPLIIYHPSLDSCAGKRRDMLTQCLDIPATLLDMLARDTPESAITLPDSDGKSLLSAIEHGDNVRNFALYGLFGGALNITDGRYTYFRYPEETENNLFEYTLMPVHPASYFLREEFKNAQWLQEHPFSHGYPLMKLPALDQARRPPMQGGALDDARTVLYDLKNDPGQQSALEDELVLQRLLDGMTKALENNHAPGELFTRFGLRQQHADR